MATIKSEPATETFPGMQTPSNCVDPLDIEQYINHDNLIFPSPSTTIDSSYAKSSTLTAPTSSSQTFMINQPPLQQTFSGPSHQYEQYKQQSSFPVGAVANTFALNESEQFSYGQDSYDMMTTSESSYDLNNMDDFVDFGSAPEQTSIDVDLSGPSQTMPVLSSSYINPSTVGDQDLSPNPPSAPSQPVRAWPGMHQQQAAMQAKAQAEAQAQRQQQAREQSSSRSRASSHTRHGNSDPHVEESISRLLDRMRRSSVTSSANDDHATPDANGHSGRMRKDEEDMDEDERLLASEEGKKLSSKERRQLRNKVSARAFRSRRKEYIGQLEGEIAAKCAEADDLRAKNVSLTAENSRLTDLTRMLLSSSHFSNFLNELSATDRSMSQGLAPQQQKRQPQNNQEAPRKDINPSQYQPHGQSQNSVHVGLAIIPESSYEHAAAESTNHGWAPSNTIDNGLYDTQVYAVTSLPEEPVIDVPLFSGKLTIEPFSSLGTMKDDTPIIESLPEAARKDTPMKSKTHHTECELDSDYSEPFFALYADQPPSSTPTPAACSGSDLENRIFGEIALEKAFNRIDIIISDDTTQNGEVGAATLEKFERIKSRMQSLGARVEAVTAHLP